MAGVALGVAGYLLLRGRALDGLVVGLLTGAGVLSAVAWGRPAALAAAHRVWQRIGATAHAIATPVLLGVVFALVVVPTAVAMRLARRDPLQRRIVRTAESYWIRRAEQPESDSWSRQF